MKKIGIFAYPGCQSLDVIGPAEVFASANKFNEEPEYEVIIFSFEKGKVKTDGGLTLFAEESWQAIQQLDTLLVPGGNLSRSYLEREDIFDWLRNTSNTCRRVTSVCTGAFWLAEAGILNNRVATTHWRHCDTLQQRYPEIKVDSDAIYIHQGNISTSAGITAGIDLCLSLVEQDLGYAVSVSVAQELLVFYRRPGGQSQFVSFQQAQSAGDKRVASAIRYIHQKLSSEIKVEQIAEHIGLSTRQLGRIFRNELNVSPNQYLLKERINLACDLLKNSDLTLERIASRSGLMSGDNLRNLFQRQFGVSPLAYRQRFKRNDVNE
ncbi:putative Transcriptional regulator, AraC family [Vibrio nigripulchritudo MADA3029]|uniref:GlxA family transcriptional regulator n=1 Tax=Vibrio nigripulchritudo TaxID=28173 RepID=UPI0003B1F696|nr:GlxA family transcriptional regulator [Vibrio nigripulchritudo]CCN49716.1 putative Transcriptional regulator, AraC family [Vibrio nigripulchritudo MADA3020]CCN54005.1 putative Transcriptional regulator, AraC family [Vibrio nigripulchritudo MADA3021]CCN57428.1 putative Transcriptional regulator, AraC family [Vibrio nigripulchritudo MADA3029]